MSIVKRLGAYTRKDYTMFDLPKGKILFQDGEPCKHYGCMNHVTHPCEGCHRIGARGVVYENMFSGYKYYQNDETGTTVKTKKVLDAKRWTEITELQYNESELKDATKKIRLRREGFQDLVIRPDGDRWEILEYTNQYGDQRWGKVDGAKFDVQDHINRFGVGFWE